MPGPGEINLLVKSLYQTGSVKYVLTNIHGGNMSDQDHYRANGNRAMLPAFAKGVQKSLSTNQNTYDLIIHQI